MANLKNTTIDGNVLQIPSGTTSERPSNPSIGEIRYNTSLDLIETYSNSGWIGTENLTQRAYIFQTDLNNFSISGRSFTEYNAFGSANINLGGFSSSSTRITVPAAGTYRAYVHAHYNVNGSREAASVSFSKNGSRLAPVGAAAYVRLSTGLRSGILDDETSVNLETLIQCNSGDEIGLQWREKADYGGPISIQGSNSLFHLEYIGI